MFKNVANQKIAVFAFDTTTGAAKTGDSANVAVYLSKDYGSVTQLTDTSATEMDATNAKGWYLFDVSQTETNADALLFTGKSSTANISVVGQLIYALPANFTAASIDSSGRVDVAKVGGTTQTAGDIFARIGAPAGASVSADIAAAKVDTAAVKVQTDKLTYTVPNQVDVNVLDWKSATAPAMTGDAFARLGAPAGASVSADVAAVKGVLPAALVSGRIDASVGAMATDTLTSAALAASAVTEIQTGLSTLDAAGIRTAVGLGSANLDTQLAAIAGYIDTEVAAILAKTNLIPGTIDGKTFVQGWTLIMAALLGKASGLATTTAVFRAVDDSKDRITATVDADGNRTAVTLDAS